MISRLAGDSAWSRYSLAWSGIQATVIVALEAVIFRLHSIEVRNIEDSIGPATYYVLNPKPDAPTPTQEELGALTYQVLQTARVLSVYHILFIVAQIFQLTLLCDAMYNKNTIQIMALVAFNCAMVAYTGVQVKQASDILLRTPGNTLQNSILNLFELPPNPTPYHASLNFEIAVSALMVIFAAGFAFIAYKLYKEFGWTIYKKIGADLAMRDMYKVYQIFIMILKFDVFFQLGFSAQFLSVVVLQYEYDYKAQPSKYALTQDAMKNILILHLILSTGASIILPILAWWGLKRESKLAMSCFIAGGVAALVYNVIKLTQVFSEMERFTGANKFLSFFLIVNLLLGLITTYLAWVCMRNFNNGLNAHIGKVSGSNIYPMESVNGPTKRWSIE